MTARTRVTQLFLAAAITAAAAVPAIAATTSPAAEVVCRANYDFCVEVDGAYPQDARFFVGDTRGKFLVDIPSQSRSVLIDLPTRRAVSIPRASIKTDSADGVVRVADPGLAASPAYALSIEGHVMRFQADTAKVRILTSLERPPQVGPISFDQLVAERPEYREGMKTYQPKATDIETLKKNRKPLEIEAYFGTWCPHCRMYMPKFLRVMQDSANPSIKLTLVGVPKNFGVEHGAWDGKNIQNIPAIIIRYEGKELTRLAAMETSAPETDLATLLDAIK